MLAVVYPDPALLLIRAIGRSTKAKAWTESVQAYAIAFFVPHYSFRKICSVRVDGKCGFA